MSMSKLTQSCLTNSQMPNGIFSRCAVINSQLSAQRRAMATVKQTKKEGDISSVFVSLSGNAPEPLPARFAHVKRTLIEGREEQVKASWIRLLRTLQKKTAEVERLGSAIIPSVKFDEIHATFPTFQKALKETGVGVIRGVVPQEVARSYKDDVERYIKDNPSTKGIYLNEKHGPDCS